MAMAVGFIRLKVKQSLVATAILLLAVVLPPGCWCKTVSGVFNTYVAQAGRGQYVTSFAFHGKGV